MGAHALSSFGYARGCGRGDVLRLMSGRRGRGRRGRGGGPFGPLAMPFPGGRRAGRGDIRAAVLALLAEEPMHGYQIMRELSERSGGSWRPSAGSVYPTLQQLEDEGLVRAEEADGRRVFHLTDAGREQAAELPSQAPWEEAADDVDEGLVVLRELTFQVGAAVMQVASAGSPSQVEAAQGALRETRKTLYRILAEDDPSDGGAAT
jgi:DNA-binding PadR family transcriptional regulator